MHWQRTALTAAETRASAFGPYEQPKSAIMMFLGTVDAVPRIPAMASSMELFILCCSVAYMKKPCKIQITLSRKLSKVPFFKKENKSFRPL
jgi:hypothetical protein